MKNNKNASEITPENTILNPEDKTLDRLEENPSQQSGDLESIELETPVPLKGKSPEPVDRIILIPPFPYTAMFLLLAAAYGSASSLITTSTGAAILENNVEATLIASATGGAVIMSSFMLEGMILMAQYLQGVVPQTNRRTLNDGFLPRLAAVAPPVTNDILIPYFFLMATCCIASPLMGQLIVYGGSTDKINMTELVADSALGTALYSVLFVCMFGRCNPCDSEDDSHDMEPFEQTPSNSLAP